ncbi:MAG: YraN family protein [Conexivisphaera sp.]
MTSGEERWRSSERIAARVLEESGFRILEEHRRIVVGGVEVGEVDILAEREGVVHAVEVKAGRLDVGGVRQAYVNALMLGAKPLVVCKGFSDSAAEVLARELGVQVLRMSDLFLVDQEELEALIREVVEDVAEDLVSFLAAEAAPAAEDLRALEAIARTSDIVEAAGELGVDVGELAKAIESMRSRGILPRWARKYSSVRRAASMALARRRLEGVLRALSEGHPPSSS